MKTIKYKGLRYVQAGRSLILDHMRYILAHPAIPLLEKMKGVTIRNVSGEDGSLEVYISPISKSQEVAEALAKSGKFKGMTIGYSRGEIDIEKDEGQLPMGSKTVQKG